MTSVYLFLLINLFVMLKYHLLLSSKNKQNLGIFDHYLTLGSHQSPYQLNNISIFSIITLFAKEKLPDIQNNSEGILSTAIVPLNGKIRIDGHNIEIEKYQKQYISVNAKNVSSFEGYEHSSVFAYIGVNNQNIQDKRIELRRYQQQTTIELNQQLLYLVDGQLDYNQEGIELNLKSNYNFEESPPLFYAAEKLSVKISKNSLILRVSDRA